jgi:chromosome segregation ATPase
LHNASLLQTALSINLCTSTTDWKTAHSSLDQICASHDEFERFFLGVFDRLEEITQELVRRQKAWFHERQEIESRVERRLADLEREKTELADEWERIREQCKVEGDQAAATDGSSGAALEQMLEESDRQRAALRDAHQSAQSHTEHLAEVARQLIDVHQELAEARAGLEHQRESLEAESTETCDARLDEASLEELRRLETQRAQWQQERAVLETELDAVRNRVAELSEALADEKRSVAEERARWSGELKRMRRVLERLPAHQVEPAAGPISEPQKLTAGESSVPSSPTGTPGGDPVLDSVAAQFEMLQKDLAKRRKAGSESTSNTTKR